MDYLSAEVRVLNPDIIGITESWADGRITEAEIGLDGYELFRCDRALNDKGGGVLLYVRASLNASGVEVLDGYPEQVWCKLKYSGTRELMVGVCYRTPSENLYVPVSTPLKLD